MDAKKRLLFVIEHLGTPFVPEIKRDLEEALNDARADELLDTGVFDGEIRHFNSDGSTTSSKDDRLEELGYKP